jgi:general secretion pathway protein G
MKSVTNMLIVAVILLMLIGVSYFIMRFPSIYNAALWSTAKPKMAPIQAAISLFVSHTGKYPNTLDDLMIPPSYAGTSWQGPYLKVQALYDPWNRPYIYVPNLADPKNYDLISYGANGKPGGGGYNKDISNK